MTQKDNPVSFDWRIKVSDVLKLIGVAVMAVYAVVEIRITTQLLRNSIVELTRVVGELNGKVEAARSDLGNVRERLAVVEHDFTYRGNIRSKDGSVR